jgi:hypothetical protein
LSKFSLSDLPLWLSVPMEKWMKWHFMT